MGAPAPQRGLRGTVVYAGEDGLFVLDLGAGAPRRLTSPGGLSDRDPALSADGARVVFVRESAANSQSQSLRLINVDGSGEREIATCAVPDGKTGYAQCQGAAVASDGTVYYGEVVRVVSANGASGGLVLKHLPPGAAAPQLWAGLAESSCGLGSLAASSDHARLVYTLKGDSCAAAGT